MEQATFMKYPHLMVDLETLGLVHNSVVLSIGAAAFCPDRGVGPSIHILVDPREQKQRRIDAGTVLWWLSQSDAARAPFRVRDDQSPGGSNNPAENEMLPPAQALARFSDFFFATCEENAEVWGNGSDFDNAILADLFRWHYRAGGPMAFKQPWKYTRNSCFRTLKKLLKAEYDLLASTIQRVGKHNAEADAVWQAGIAYRLLRHLRACEGVAAEATGFAKDENAAIDGLAAAVEAYAKALD